MSLILPLPMPPLRAIPAGLKAVGLVAIVASVKLIDAAEKRVLKLFRELELGDGGLGQAC